MCTTLTPFIYRKLRVSIEQRKIEGTCCKGNSCKSGGFPLDLILYLLASIYIKKIRKTRVGMARTLLPSIGVLLCPMSWYHNIKISRLIIFTLSQLIPVSRKEGRYIFHKQLYGCCLVNSFITGRNKMSYTLT